MSAHLNFVGINLEFYYAFLYQFFCFSFDFFIGEIFVNEETTHLEIVALRLEIRVASQICAYCRQVLADCLLIH